MSSEAGTISKYAGEFLGTFFLTFMVGLNITECEQVTGFGPIAIGCTVMVLVYTFSPISGGHLNPAVTFSVLLQEKLNPSPGEPQWKEAAKYVVAQCAGGALAGLFGGFMVGFEHSSASLGPTSSLMWLGAPLVEFTYTFLLCFVFLNVLVSYDKLTDSVDTQAPSEPPAGYGVAIGFVYIAAKGAVAISGCALNPAVTLGINFMGPTWKTIYLPIYMAVQLAAGFAATTALHIVRPATRKSDLDIVKGRVTELAHKVEEKLDPEDTAEFLGSFFIGLTISLNAMIPENPGAIWSVGTCFMVVIYALGPVSGGVFNPALTLAFCGRWYGTGQGFGENKLCDPLKSQKEWVKYCIVQLIGAAAGTGVTILVYLCSGEWPSPNVGPSCINVHGAIADPATCERHSSGQAFFAEFFGTFLLCFVVLSVASVPNHPLGDYKAFAIGSCIIAAGYLFGSISGGLLNPAVTLCNSIGTFQALTSTNPALYVVAQFCGGVTSAAVFRKLTHAHCVGELQEPLLREEPTA